MDKVFFLLPRAQMIQLAREIASEWDDTLQTEFLLVDTNTVIDQAKKAVSAGADLIIARGYQAQLIKQNVPVPLVELVLTGQEIGLLLTRAKRMLNKERPKIAIVGIRNMFCDIRHFSDIFEVELATYFVDSVEELQGAAEQAIRDKPDIIIGGDTAVNAARGAGVESLFLYGTIDSIREAMRVAKNLLHAVHLEKLNFAQMETLLEYSFNGIIQLDTEGRIVSLNPVIQKILNKSPHEINGKHITQVIKDVDPETIDDALLRGKEKLSSFLSINNIAVVMNVACIRVKDEIKGVILSFQEITRIEQMSASVRREQYLNRHIVQGDFRLIEKKSPKMKASIEKAKIYLTSKSPVLLYGEPGTEKNLFAQCIHNGGVRRNGPFVEVSAGGIPARQQAEVLFGDSQQEQGHSSLLESAQYGTLHISEVEKLSLECQYTLKNIIQSSILIRNHRSRPEPVDVRLICSTSANLIQCMEQGMFREDLFYTLSALTLHIPPLRQRTEDIHAYTQQFIEQYCKEYAKFITLSEGAVKYLEKYPWEGNLIQLKSFCENLVICAAQRKIDEIFIERLLHELYPIVRSSPTSQKPIVFTSQEAANIAAAYDKYAGNRGLMAQALNVSKTTLWRQMKKHGITDDLFTEAGND